ncbi:MAG: alginate export family protein [Bacteroidetes bacterium]|nr:alginate export family protein [Bacteroidota bacterium]MBU1579385.1 alginate export family protein [Bacteroidota bacterium]MBU2466900.1 alginate export family protein [Bacteroidota bacterium]MBU2557792.1 alginate export family protein [Bacteroidota bacterium]
MKKTVKNLTRLFLLAGIIGGIQPLLKAQFSLEAQIRPRTEYRNGFKQLVTEDAESAFFVSQRSRLNALYKKDKVQLGISFQDVRVWGDQPQLAASSNQLMVHQAWAAYLINDHLKFKLGRQELVYDDARILGNVDWAQQARSHDLALLTYEQNFKLHIGAAYNQQEERLLGTDYQIANNYKTMQFAWFHKKFDHWNLSLLVLNNGWQHDYITDEVEKYKTVFSQTLGGRFSYLHKAFRFNAASYFSTGKDANDRALAAYYFAADANYKANSNWNFSLGWEYLSGTSELEKLNNEDYTNKSFNPYYGTNHKFNGYMDYFYVGNHINSVGLSDVFLSAKYQQTKWNLQGALHFFSAANEVLNQDVINALEAMPNKLGTEFDLVYSYQLSPQVALSAGYSQIFGTKTLEMLKGGDADTANNWAWLMINFNPKLIQELF